MKKRKFKQSIFVFAICSLLFTNRSTVLATTIDSTDSKQPSATAPSNWPAAPKVTAESAIIMDASSGVILYEKNSKEAKYPASITKILTTLIAIENSSLSDTVTFSRDAVFGVDLDSSRIGIDVGEKLSMEDCLYGIMLASANEVSYAVAEHVGGTMEAFVELMNKKVAELGCVNTNFMNPHGLQNENHYTCAYDMALIAQEAIKNTTFKKITGTRSYVIDPTNIQKEARPLANHHKFIKRDILYPGAIGGKTGYTSSAKYTLVTYAERNDMQLICVVMGSDSVASEYTDTSSLLDYGFDNFTLHNISSSKNEFLHGNTQLFSKYSNLFNADNALLTTGDNGYVILPSNVSLDESVKTITYKPIEKLSEGDNVIGNIIYTYKDKVVGKTDIIFRHNTNESLPIKINTLTNSSLLASFSYASIRSMNPFFLILMIIVFLIVIAFVFLYIRKKRIRHKRNRKTTSYRNRYDYY